VAGKQGDELVFKGLERVRTDWMRLVRAFQEALYQR
jgi:DNA polymerase elongation subunit (family B)